jgi:hypothetical protein
MIEVMFEDDLALLKKKGADYSGVIDAMSNFRDFGFFGIIVRLNDKMARLKTLTSRKGFKQVSSEATDESIIDTLRDLRNYSYLAQIMYVEENKNGNAI